MPDTLHPPPIPMPTLEPLSMHRTLLAMKEAIELLAGTRGNAGATPMMAHTVMATRHGTLAAAPFKLPLYNGFNLPEATRFPNSVLLATDNTGGTRLLVSDGVRWREASGMIYAP